MHSQDGLFSDPGFTGAGRHGNQAIRRVDGCKGFQLKRIRRKRLRAGYADLGKDLFEFCVGRRFDL